MFNARDLIEHDLDPTVNHASDTGCLACELTHRRHKKLLADALRVFMLDPKTRAYLDANDPMAVAQATEALTHAGD